MQFREEDRLRIYHAFEGTCHCEMPHVDLSDPINYMISFMSPGPHDEDDDYSPVKSYIHTNIF